MPLPSPKLLHVDEALIVAEKPAGLLSVPAAGREDCLVSRIQVLYPDALIVHRLDQATSGLILLARGAGMLRRLSLAFEQRIIGKRYVALVQGHPASDEGEIDLALAEDPACRPRQRVDPVHGRRALTRYRVLARSAGGEAAFSRVELKPVTGRTHQLRVHLLAIGHPILGDPLYAPPASVAAHARLHLHAAGLALMHPHTRLPLQFDSPVPF